MDGLCGFHMLKKFTHSDAFTTIVRLTSVLQLRSQCNCIVASLLFPSEYQGVGTGKFERQFHNVACKVKRVMENKRRADWSTVNFLV